MSTVSQIVTGSFRETNIIPVGGNPTVMQRTEATYYLGNILQSVFGNAIGYQFQDWDVRTSELIYDPSGVPIIADGFTVLPQSRLVCNLSEEMTLLLDEFPQDGQRFSVIDVAGNFSSYNLNLFGNRRLIDQQTNLTLSDDSFSAQWLYRADLASWMKIPVVLEDATPWPLPVEFDDYFIVMLCARLEPRYGRSMDDASKARLAQQASQLTARYGQSQMRQAATVQGPQPGLQGE